MTHNSFRHVSKVALTALLDALVILGAFGLPLFTFLDASGCGGGTLLGLLVAPICLLVGLARFGRRAWLGHGWKRAASCLLLGLSVAASGAWFIPSLHMFQRSYSAGFRVRMAVTVGLGNLQRVAVQALEDNREPLMDESVSGIDLPGKWNAEIHEPPAPLLAPAYLARLERFDPGWVRLTKRFGKPCLEVYVGGGFLGYMAILVGPTGFTPEESPGFLEKWADGIYFASN